MRSTAIPRISPSLNQRWLQSGFTLVEIVVVVVILAIFAGMMSLSVGSSEVRKNSAFYEHLVDTLGYVRLLSAERMQPMGLALKADQEGQVTPVIVALNNPYSGLQSKGRPKNKDAMELSTDIEGLSAMKEDQVTPSWQVEPDVQLPKLPTGVTLTIASLEPQDTANRKLQPWFLAQDVPQVLWFGTGQAAPVTLEVRHQSRLVGEVITIMPDGSIKQGQDQ
nr:MULTISPECIES: prepilin-type N-terminal cleavage/methylation domain-containing protein [Psychrobacter]